MLSRKVDVWLPMSARADTAAKGDGLPEIERMMPRVETRRAFNTGFLTSSLTTAATPAPSSGSSGTGFGGGSSFGGGGFSGGGGGGGGGGSW